MTSKAQTSAGTCLFAFTLIALGSMQSLAQQPKVNDTAKDYPSKPIRWIIDFGAGGLSDTLARIVAQKLTEAWGQPVINDVRPGVNGTIADEIGSKATPTATRCCLSPHRSRSISASTTSCRSIHARTLRRSR